MFKIYLIILGSLVNIIDGTCMIVDKQENLHFDSEKVIHNTFLWHF